MRRSGLAANSAADGSSRGNNSVNCFACTQIHRFDADRADRRQLSCVQSLPSVLGAADWAYSLLVALSLLAINQFFIGISNETGGAGCGLRLSCYCCYSRIYGVYSRIPHSIANG